MGQGGKKQILSETGWESVSCQGTFQSWFADMASEAGAASGLKESQNQRAEGHIKGAAADTESFSDGAYPG